MRIRVTTRAELFEQRKQQHIERGYRIEDEQATPINGLCSFIAVQELPGSDPIGELVARALKGQTLGRIEEASVAFAFPLAEGAHRCPGTKSLISQVHYPRLRTENREPQI